MPGATEQSRSRVQDQTERFTPNGNFYAFRTACMSRSLMYPPGCRIAPHEVPQPYSLDIDTGDDFKMAEAVAIGWQLAPELIPSDGRRRASL